MATSPSPDEPREFTRRSSPSRRRANCTTWTSSAKPGSARQPSRRSPNWPSCIARWGSTTAEKHRRATAARLGIFFAKKLSGQFATDDNGAYEFARRQPSLGTGRVIDSIHILRTAVAHGYLTAADAHSVATEIEGAGRSLRPDHRGTRGPNYFLR